MHGYKWLQVVVDQFARIRKYDSNPRHLSTEHCDDLEITYIHIYTAVVFRMIQYYSIKDQSKHTLLIHQHGARHAPCLLFMPGVLVQMKIGVRSGGA